MQKPVERFVGGRMMVEVMALMEGLDAALGLGIRSVTIVTAYGPLYNHVCHAKCQILDKSTPPSSILYFLYTKVKIDLPKRYGQ